MKKLPLGKNTFSQIIAENKLYVDKTEEIYKLLENGSGNYFLSRPRRFGKSLLVSTLEEIFNGNKEVFKDLWIYNKISWKKYLVINLDFSNIDSSTPERLEKSLSNTLFSIAKNYNIRLEDKYTYKENFALLIQELSKIEKVIILIDEYDKPIIDHITNLEIVEKTRDILKNFYSTLKGMDQYIYFIFLTGVSKFSKVSVFSGLNNLNDITIDPNFSKIVGIDEEQLYSYFDENIKLLAKKESVTIEVLKKELKKWYNGYSWDGKNFLYNPYSILSLFSKNEIKNYWFQSGTPTFLIKLIRNYHIDIKKLENLLLNEKDFDSYEVDKMNVMALLFQTGYLTIKEVIKEGFARTYMLSYSNMEVKDSLLNYLLDDFTENNEANGVSVNRLVKSLKNKDLKVFFQILMSMFASIPNQIFPENTSLADKEAYYHTIFHIIFTLMGTNIKSEVSTSKGRIDSVIETNDIIYIFEFKVGRAPRKAIEQIERKNYYEIYKASNKEIFMIGVNFSIAKRNIKDWKVKEVKK